MSLRYHKKNKETTKVHTRVFVNRQRKIDIFRDYYALSIED